MEARYHTSNAPEGKHVRKVQRNAALLQLCTHRTCYGRKQSKLHVRNKNAILGHRWWIVRGQIRNRAAKKKNIYYGYIPHAFPTGLVHLATIKFHGCFVGCLHTRAAIKNYYPANTDTKRTHTLRFLRLERIGVSRDSVRSSTFCEPACRR